MENTRAQLAALIVAAGLLNTTAATARTDQSGGLWLKDRSNLIAHASKDSACGKCASQGMCGESYQDGKKKKNKTTTRHASQRLRSHDNRNAKRGNR